LDNIVNVIKRDDLNIKIVTDDSDYLRLLKSEFEYLVEGYHFMPAYRSGGWNGRTCVMRPDNSLPYGLLTELIRINKTSFPRVTLRIHEDVKMMFNGPPLKLKQNLSLKPYPYQKDCIIKSLHYSKGIIRSATASGKCSFDIDIIIKMDDKLYKEKFSDYKNLEENI